MLLRAAARLRRTASFFLVLGCLSVLGGAFVLGVVAGRAWLTFPFGASRGAAPAATKDKGDRSARAPEPPPTLTFYRELTAPLTAPPAPRPSRPARVDRTEGPTLPSVGASLPTPPTPKDGRFTVQVGAYKVREPAEALRARLTAAGHDAYIAEAEGPGGARFRVRVGAFATREAAKEFATRIATDWSVSTFVTTR